VSYASADGQCSCTAHFHGMKALAKDVVTQPRKQHHSDRLRCTGMYLGKQGTMRHTPLASPNQAQKTSPHVAPRYMLADATNSNMLLVTTKASALQCNRIRESAILPGDTLSICLATTRGLQVARAACRPAGHVWLNLVHAVATPGHECHANMRM
jgi:hypothetical protein